MVSNQSLNRKLKKLGYALYDPMVWVKQPVNYYYLRIEGHDDEDIFAFIKAKQIFPVSGGDRQYNIVVYADTIKALNKKLEAIDEEIVAKIKLTNGCIDPVVLLKKFDERMSAKEYYEYHKKKGVL